MKKLTILAILAVAALALALVPATLAQNNPPTFGLSQTDFALLQAANAATVAAKSLQFDYTLNMNISATSTSNGTTTPVTVTGAITGAGGFDRTDTSNPAFQLTAQGSVNSNDTPTAINFEARVANQNLYFNATGEDTAWQGIALADIPNLFSGMAGMMGVNPSALSGATQQGGAANSQMMQQLAPMMQALSQINPEDFIGMTRADEGSTAHFTINVDVKKFLSSPAVAQVMAQAAQMQAATAGGTTGGSTGGASSGMNPQQVMQMVQALVQTANITIDQYVDTTSSMVTRTTLTVAVNVMSMSGGAPTTVNVTFDINLHDFNTGFSVAAPANATMIPVPTPEASSGVS